MYSCALGGSLRFFYSHARTFSLAAVPLKTWSSSLSDRENWCISKEKSVFKNQKW